MAMPASACASAAASLMPSPTMATRRPDFCSSRIRCQLPRRIESRFDLGDPGLLRNRRGRGGRIAGQHQHAQALVAQRGNRIRASGRSASRASKYPAAAPSSAIHSRVTPGSGAATSAGSAMPELAEQRFIAQQAIVPFHARRQSAAGQDLHILRRLPLQAPRLRSIDHCVRQRMIRPLLRRRCHAQQIVL